ncbi:MAG: DinB family protein [Gemmatimonadota bacterium]|nr:DinB family protein [Gemmatimonadota bacterium]
MNKNTLDGVWDHTRQKYGIYLRLLELIPEDKLQETVIPGMRTPAQLVAHTSGGIVREVAKGIATGEIKNAPDESEVAAGLKTRAEILEFARACWDEANAAIGSSGDEQLSATVNTPWGMSFPGTACVHLLNDEFTHHRGQLYAYVRACGAEPPFMWSFEDNPAGFERGGGPFS